MSRRSDSAVVGLWLQPERRRILKLAPDHLARFDVSAHLLVRPGVYQLEGRRFQRLRLQARQTWRAMAASFASPSSL